MDQGRKVRKKGKDTNEEEGQEEQKDSEIRKDMKRNKTGLRGDERTVEGGNKRAGG